MPYNLLDAREQVRVNKETHRLTTNIVVAIKRVAPEFDNMCASQVAVHFTDKSNVPDVKSILEHIQKGRCRFRLGQRSASVA